MIKGAVECGRVGSVLLGIKCFKSYIFGISDSSENYWELDDRGSCGVWEGWKCTFKNQKFWKL